MQLLFQMCLFSSIVPDSFISGTVTSILKRGKDTSDCSSYRSIAVTCTLSKIFEHVLLQSINESAFNGENWFGYKQGIIWAHAHGVLTHVLRQTSQRNEQVHFVR